MSNPQPTSSDHIPMWTECGISVLNGVIGDYLQQRQNGLAIAMAFYHQNRPLLISTESLHNAHPNLTTKLCILVHGLGCNESIWAFRNAAQRYSGTSYGTLLQKELDYTPFYLRYNTGLPISENGKGLAALLDDLLTCYPASVADIMLIGHSMGGLVLRSACHYGVRRHHAWVDKVRRAFYLGTPHSGADLEKLGYGVTRVLQAVPNPITRLISAILNLRSQGVKDLRSGNLLAEERLEDSWDALEHDQLRTIAWLPDVRHYFIAGALTKDPGHVATQLFGDALVRVAHGHGCLPQEDLSAPEPGANVKLLRRVHHLALAHDLRVYRQIRRWCSSE